MCNLFRIWYLIIKSGEQKNFIAFFFGCFLFRLFLSSVIIINRFCWHYLATIPVIITLELAYSPVIIGPWTVWNIHTYIQKKMSTVAMQTVNRAKNMSIDVFHIPYWHPNIFFSSKAIVGECKEEEKINKICNIPARLFLMIIIIIVCSLRKGERKCLI